MMKAGSFRRSLIRASTYMLFTLSSSLFTVPARAQWVQVLKISNVAAQFDCFTENSAGVFAGAVSGGIGVYLSTNDGASWNLRSMGSIYTITALGNDLFAGVLGGSGIYISTDNGVTWKSANHGLPDTVVYNIVVSGNTLFAATSRHGIYFSADTGASWNPDTVGFPITSHPQALAIHGGYLFAGTQSNGIYRIPLSGGVWAQANNGLGADTDITSLTTLWAFGNDLFAGTSKGGGIFISTDDGASWSSIGNGLPDTTNYFVSSITTRNAFIPEDKPDLFAGTYGYGVYHSTNNGASWLAIDSGLTDLHIYSLTVSGEYIIAGSTTGIWRRSLADFPLTAVNEPPQNIAPGQIDLAQNFPNPFSASTTIEYMLPRSSPVTLKIYNALGEEVAVLANGEQVAGRQSVAFNGADLNNGMYFYRLTAGKDTQTGKMSVVH